MEKEILNLFPFSECFECMNEWMNAMLSPKPNCIFAFTNLWRTQYVRVIAFRSLLFLGKSRGAEQQSKVYSVKLTSRGA